MDEGAFIIKCGDTYYGPFLSYETAVFLEGLERPSEVVRLSVPRLPEETPGPAELRVMQSASYRNFVDGFKCDTRHVLAGIIQQLYFARRDDRVLTAREMFQIWGLLFELAHAVESLMHYAESAVANPTPENLAALRKAFWRNRDADDVDPHYADRFW